MILRIIGDDGSLHRPRPLASAEDWRLRISEDGGRSRQLGLSELAALGTVERTRGITCVSAANIVPGGGEVTFGGIPFTALFQRVFAESPAAGLTVELVSRAPGTVGPKSERHSTHLTLEDCLEPEHGLLLATHLDGEPLPYANGGPLRAVAPPHLFFYKSIKWLEEIRLLEGPLEDYRGTWEEHSGYHNRARIARGERFEPRMRWILAVRLPPESAPDGTPEDETELVPPERWQEVFESCYREGDFRRLVAAQLHKMFGRLPKDFRGMRFSDGELRAKIRGTSFASADFSGARCTGCNFSLSKFTNTRFSEEGENPADLSECDFEGAYFNHAHLQGVSLKGANLSNATFYGPGEAEATSDRVRGLDLRGAQNLSPQTARWLARGGAILD